MKYNLGFTAGALLMKEADIYINSIESVEVFFTGQEEVDYMHIPTNSESGKKRIKAELDKRFKNLNPDYLLLYKSENIQDRKIILYLSVCKTYSIIPEFALEILYTKWKQFDYEVSTYDFEYFLSKKLDDEIDSISEKTRYKLSQVAIKIFKEVGILKKDKIDVVYPSEKLKQRLIPNGDGWILNCLMIPNED